MECVRYAGDELVKVLFVTGGGIVQVVVGRGKAGAEPFIDRQRQDSGEVVRVVIGVVEGGQNICRLREEHLLVGHVAAIGLGDGRADELGAGRNDSGSSVDGSVEVGLGLVVQVGLEVQLLFGALHRGPADATAVRLRCSPSPWRVVVVEGRITEGVEARREVLVTLGVSMEDAAQRDDIRRWR